MDFHWHMVSDEFPERRWLARDEERRGRSLVGPRRWLSARSVHGSDHEIRGALCTDRLNRTRVQLELERVWGYILQAAGRFKEVWAI